MKRWLKVWWHWFVQGVKAWLCVGIAFGGAALLGGAIHNSLMWALKRLADRGFDLLWLETGIGWFFFLLLISFFGSTLYHCLQIFPLRNYEPGKKDLQLTSEKSETE